MATRKAAAKKAAKKTATKKAAAKKSPAKRVSAKKSASKKAPAKKGSKSSADNYTKPKLREKIKKQVLAGSKGGRAGQWSARKAQLVTNEYEAEGGRYKKPRSRAQRSLKQWGDEKWRTSDGKQAVKGKVTHRYLPDEAWKALPAKERKATDRKKVTGSKKGKQFVANTPKAAKARKSASRGRN